MKRIWLGATTASVLLLLAACGGPGGSETPVAPGSTGPTDENKTYTIALVPGMTAHPFYVTMHLGAQQAAKDLGVELVYQGAADWAVEDQNRVLDTVLIQKPDALLVVPVDSKGSASGIRKFVDAGIPVFTVDTNIDDESLYLSNVTGDNEAGGAMAAKALAEAVGAKGKVAVIGTNPGTSVDELRTRGFEQEVQKNYPEMEVVAKEYGGEDPTGGQRVAEGLMLAHQDLVGIFGVNGYMATGAANAVAATGRTDSVFVAGYDADPALVEVLRRGDLAIIVAQQPAEMARVAMGFAKEYLEGTRTEFEKSVKIPNVIVTVENVDDPDIQPFLYQDE